MYLSNIRHIYDFPPANIIPHNEKLKVFPLRSRVRHIPLLPYPLNIVLEILSKAIKQGIEMKSIQVRKKENDICGWYNLIYGQSWGVYQKTVRNNQ